MKTRLLIPAAALLMLFGCSSEDPAADTSGEYDFDITDLNANMMYGQVYDMTFNSEKYMGKTVKLKGQFRYNKYSENQVIYSVFIPDAAACCSQGIEFIPKDPLVYPDDFPEIDQEITVAGTFSTYEEYAVIYCQLKDAEILSVSE